MTEKNGIPKLRFPGFSGAWEQRKLKELGDIQTGNTPPTSNLDNYSTDGVLWVTPTDIKTLVISDTAKKLSEVGVTKARIAKAGSILVTSIASIGKNTLVTMDAGFNQQINSLTPTPKNDSYFLLTQSEKWSEKMKKTAASATMQIVNKTDFSNISTFVPVHKEEQQKIGSFFKELDDTIALHQRRLDHIKELKKGLLQKMFPKEGETVPEIRFPEFTNAWELRKLSDIADRFDNLRVPITASDRKSGDTPYYGANGIQDYVEGFTHDGEFILVAEDGANDLKNYPVQYVNGKVWVNNHAHVLQGKNTITDNKFLMNSIKNFNIEPFLVGGGRAKLNADVMMKLNILLPTFDEQEKIGSLFSLLDKTIALHQRKLDHLQQLKKALLQQMFV